MENKKKKSFGQKIKELLTAKSVGGIIVRMIILLAIPYAYLLLCGLIFDKWLRMYQMTTFIFISLCVLYVIAIVLCVLTIKWSNEAMKSPKKPRRNTVRKEKTETEPEETKSEKAEPEPIDKKAVEEPIAEEQIKEEPASETVIIEEEQISMDLASMAQKLKEAEKANTEE